MSEHVRANNVEVFRKGDYGERGNYSESDLDAIAAAYDPSAHEAPVTVDHDSGGPAMGWVKALRVKAGSLFADMDLLPGFAQKVRDGEFKKRSIELYREPKSVRAITWLGAAPPVVKGMQDAVFSENEGEFTSFKGVAELDSDIFQAEPTPEPEAEAGEIPLKDAEGNYSEKLVGRAISYFSPGGFGGKHEKITPLEPHYLETKRRIADACFKLGKDPAWAELKTEDTLYDPAITVESLKAHRSDIIEQLTFELQEEIHMSDEKKEEMASLKADLETKNTECSEMSEKIEAFEAKEAKAKMSEELDAVIAKAKLSERGANEIRRQYAERDNLDGIQDSITGVQTLLEGAKFEEPKAVEDMPGGANATGGEAKRIAAKALAEEKGISISEAYREIMGKDESFSAMED